MIYTLYTSQQNVQKNCIRFRYIIKLHTSFQLQAYKNMLNW